MTAEPLIRLPPALSRPQHRADARFVLGVDGGATKTLAAVLEVQTGRLHMAHGGSSNEDTVGARVAVDTLLATADEALGGAEISRRELTTAVLAIAGTDTAAISRRVHACADAGQWIVVNDVVAAWAAATGARPGVGAVSGTGSNVFGVGPGGQTWRTGGWGHLLGDEGSGYWLGIQSIRAALRERDGSGPATALTAAAVSFFGASSVEAVADLVYAKPLSKAEIAVFSVETARVANQGDEVARELYTRAGAELGSQILVVVRHTGLAPHGEFPVGLIGSAFKAGSAFVDPLAATVRASAPHARISVVHMAPVGGSLLLAAHAAGHEVRASELSAALALALGHGG